MDGGFSFTQAMPFNLPSWMLSAKNRSDLLRLIRRLKKRLPKDFVPAERIENLAVAQWPSPSNPALPISTVGSLILTFHVFD